jgi:TPR repeat protein
MARGALALAALALLCMACDGCREKRRPEPDMTRYQAPSSEPSAVTIANAFATCDDTKACEAACDAGVADQCRLLGTTYQFGNAAVKKDDLRALAYFEQACAMKNAAACVSAGQIYEFHHGVDKDDVKAADFYRRGCDIGDQVACANFAIMLENGRGVATDVERAAILYDKACRAGAGLACDRLKHLRPADAATE